MGLITGVTANLPGDWKRQAAPTTGRTRHEKGRMNKLETRYAAHLDWLKMAKELECWAFEPFKLRLADRTFYEIDFLVKMPDGSLQVHEVKGHWEDDARVKIKVAAAMFGEFFRFRGVRWIDGSWQYEEFGR